MIKRIVSQAILYVKYRDPVFAVQLTIKIAESF